MADKMQVIQNKRVRGHILTLLELTHPTPTPCDTVASALLSSGLITNPDIAKQVDYLADKGYVKVYLGDEVLSLVQDPPREALVRLTAKGIDLMEGTLDDEGVAFGDPMRQ